MNKHYACSDLHGMYSLWEQIKNYIDDTDTVYFLGDAADRGPDGVKLMTELLTDKRVVYLKGNHEQFFETYANQEGCHSLWYRNGGKSTYDAAQLMNEVVRDNLVGMVRRLPVSAAYQNKDGKIVLMCHAGTHFGWDEQRWKSLGVKDPYTWNRDHFHMKWNAETARGSGIDYIVHGHTPTPILRTHYDISDDDGPEDIYVDANNIKQENVKIVKYCNKRKIDIDLGAFFTHKTCLLDLDTLEPIYFVEEQ